jgi:hypothetical protein
LKNGILINKPRDNAEAFFKHFQSVYGTSCPGIFPFVNQSTEILSFSCYFKLGCSQFYTTVAAKNSVELDGVPSFVIKDYSENFVPPLKFNLILAYLRIFFPTCEGKQLLPLVSKIGKPSSVGNKLIAINNNFLQCF